MEGSAASALVPPTPSDPSHRHKGSSLQSGKPKAAAATPVSGKAPVPTSPPKSPFTGGSSSADVLEARLFNLKRLRTMDYITEAEYNEKRQRILDEI